MPRKTVGLSVDEVFVELLDKHVEMINAHQPLGVATTRSGFMRAVVTAAIKNGAGLPDNPIHVRERTRQA